MNESQPAFVSYSRQDSIFALKLAKDLKNSGAIVWFDQIDIGPGERWDMAVEQALSTAKYLIVILSPVSVGSNNVMDEVSFALGEQKAVIPVLYQTCQIPFRLRRLQYVDARSDYHRAVTDLLKRLEVVEKMPPPAPPPKNFWARKSALGLLAVAAAIFLAFIGWSMTRPNPPRSETTKCLADTTTFFDAKKLVEFRYPAQCFHPEKTLDRSEVVRLESGEGVVVSVSIYPTDRDDALAKAYEAELEISARQIDYKTGIRTNETKNEWYVVSGTEGSVAFYRRVISTRGHLAAMTIISARKVRPSVNAPVVIAQTFHALS